MTTDVQILEIANRHVRRFGAKQVTMVALAKELGMTHANLYRYFQNRLALLDAITADWLRPLEMRLRQAADGQDPPEDKLERMLLAIHRAYREKLLQDPLIFELFVEAAVEERLVARKHRAKVQQEIQAVLEEGMAAGLLGVRERRHGMALIFDAAHRFIHPFAIKLDEQMGSADLEQRFERLLQPMLRALRSGRL